jgi:hypothetical protein
VFENDKSSFTVEIPENSLVDENQTLYSGAYTLDVYFLDINDGNTWKYMPGGFTGIHN